MAFLLQTETVESPPSSSSTLSSTLTKSALPDVSGARRRRHASSGVHPTVLPSIPTKLPVLSLPDDFGPTPSSRERTHSNRSLGRVGTPTNLPCMTPTLRTPTGSVLVESSPMARSPVSPLSPNLSPGGNIVHHHHRQRRLRVVSVDTADDPSSSLM